MTFSYQNGNKGISPIIGVILIVTITVLLVSLASFVVFDVTKESSETPKSTVILSDKDVLLVRMGNADEVIVREGGVPDYKLSIGETYTISGDYKFNIIAIIDGQETLIQSGKGKQISSRNNKQAEDIQEVYDNLDGDGTDSNPYIITNDQELQAMNKDIDGHYKLGNNIDAAGTNNWYDGDGFKPISTFKGSLDGDGYEISGLHIDRPTESNIGLIAESEAEIHDIGFTNTDIRGDENVGSIIGRNSNHVSITNSYSLGNVDGNVNVGGIIGLNHNHAEIRESYSVYDITGDINVGGIIGKNNNHADIYDSYSNGTIEGNEYVGGIIGHNNNHGNIYTSYSSGNIEGGDNTGGLIGNINGDIVDSYWDVIVTGQEQRDPEEGTGLRTEEMQGEDNELDGFNFVDIWHIQSDDYPNLQWES